MVLIAALPPDVRRGYASPVVTLLNTWATTVVRPLALEGEARTGGEAGVSLSNGHGEVQPRRTSGGKAR